jgi:hypothetical protein
MAEVYIFTIFTLRPQVEDATDGDYYGTQAEYNIEDLVTANYFHGNIF